MARIVVVGVVVALAAALVVLAGPALGLSTAWPVLAAVAIGLGAGALTVGRVGAFVLGAVLGWVVMAVRAGFLPQVPASQVLTLVAAVVLLAAVAALTADAVPLWAGLAGLAVFAGVYEPVYAASPTTFLADSPVALLTVLIAAGVGFTVAGVAQAVGIGLGGDATVVRRAGRDGPPGVEPVTTSEPTVGGAR